MSVALLTLKSNREFLDLYHPYIKTEWRRHYFFYDRLKAEYKILKDQKHPKLQKFEEDFLAEIKRVDWFLKITLDDITQDLRMIEEAKEPFLTQKSSLQKQQTEHTIEVAIRGIFEKCKACEQFYQLNHFVICKIAKKFEKLIESTHASRNKKEGSDEEQKLDFVPWTKYRSNEFFNKDFSRRSNRIIKLKQQCILLYSDFFRQKYPSLAFGELEFMKNKDREHKRTRIIFGIKLGLIIALISWVVFDSLLTSTRFDFWVQPGLYVYTTVGNLLLFRLLWSLNIFVWSRYDINFIPLLSLENLKPNLLVVSNSTATQFVLYALNLVIFFEANSMSTPLLSKTPLRYICPFLLLVWSICFEAYEYIVRYNGLVIKYSRGLFSRDVFLRCFIAPFTVVRFRDVFAADVLTSFTKVISDTLYASCWILSGQFLVPPDEDYDKYGHTAFGSSALVCSSARMVIAVAIAVCIPLWIRFLQCIRQWRDNKWQMWPFMFNAIKYLSSMVVVIYGANTDVHAIEPTYMNLVIITTLYKWWWDVVMDWGLFAVMPTVTDLKTFMKPSSLGRRNRRRSTLTNTSISTPSVSVTNNNNNNNNSIEPRKSQVLENNSNTKTFEVPHHHHHHREKPYLFLRPLLMYPSHHVYYAAIVMDLILRFMWVASLVPKELFGDFVGPQLSFFLGSMEIVRRAMWGVFRLEYEHLKHVQKGAAGFLKYRRTSYDFSRKESRENAKVPNYNNNNDNNNNSNNAMDKNSPLLDARLRRGNSATQLVDMLRSSKNYDNIELINMKNNSEMNNSQHLDEEPYLYEELPSVSLGEVYDMVQDGEDDPLVNSNDHLSSDEAHTLYRNQEDEEGATDHDDERNRYHYSLRQLSSSHSDPDSMRSDTAEYINNNKRNTTQSKSLLHSNHTEKKKKRDAFNADFSMHTMVAMQAMMDESHHSNSNSPNNHNQPHHINNNEEDIADNVQPFHRQQSSNFRALSHRNLAHTYDGKDDTTNFAHESDDDHYRCFPGRPPMIEDPDTVENDSRSTAKKHSSSKSCRKLELRCASLSSSEDDNEDEKDGMVTRHRKVTIGLISRSNSKMSLSFFGSSNCNHHHTNNDNHTNNNNHNHNGLRSRQISHSTSPVRNLSRQNTSNVNANDMIPPQPLHFSDTEDL